MSSGQERERIAHELEARSLIPDRARRAAIHAEAEQVARRVQQRRDAAQARKAAVEAKLKRLREDPLDWLNE